MTDCQEKRGRPPRQKVVLFTEWFPPEPVRIPLSIARSLRSRAAEVEVVTAIPNLPLGVVHPPYRAWRPVREVFDGFVVNRLPVFPSHDASALKRIVTYLSWGITSALLSARSIRRADVALVYSSPATAALAPALWTRVLGTPYALLIQDLWPDSVTATGFVQRTRVAALMEAFLHPFVRWTYRRASEILVISPGMLEELVRRGVPRGKLSLVYNWVDPEEVRPPPDNTSRAAARKSLGLSTQDFVVTYAGAHGKAQGLSNILDALKGLVLSRLVVLFVGEGVEKRALKNQAQTQGLAQIRFLDAVDRSEMVAVNAATDVHLVSLIRRPLFEITMPSKVQSILASGTPLIVVGEGDAAAVVRDSGAGWVVAPGEPQGFREAVLAAASMAEQDLRGMGLRGRSYYDDCMSERVGGSRLDTLLWEMHQNRRWEHGKDQGARQ